MVKKEIEMNSKVVLASVLALSAVSAQAAQMGRAVPVISCKSAHISIVVFQATCRLAPNAGDPTCQASVSVDGGAPVSVMLTQMRGPFPQTNMQSLALQPQRGGPVVSFFGMDRGNSGTYTGQGHVQLPSINTTEDMTCSVPQHQQGHL
jgi:hypothetical protein